MLDFPCRLDFSHGKRKIIFIQHRTHTHTHSWHQGCWNQKCGRRFFCSIRQKNEISQQSRDFGQFRAAVGKKSTAGIVKSHQWERTGCLLIGEEWQILELSSRIPSANRAGGGCILIKQSGISQVMELKIKRAKRRSHGLGGCSSNEDCSEQEKWERMR